MPGKPTLDYARSDAADADAASHRYLPKPDGFRDTIESIVIAFIFAFVFRAFIVEAFVIPTGSMAPTLYGLHGQHRCAACQYPFAYGIREGAVDRNGDLVGSTLAKQFSVRCPSCGWIAEGDGSLNLPGHRVTEQAGDRILVLKWPYGIGGDYLGPARWDVVVFKDPQDGDQNFIKRLLGLPGEALELIDGDLYAAPAADLSPELRDWLGRPRAEGRSDPRQLPAPLRRELDDKLRIQRKTDVAQQALWRIHYDHDYPIDERYKNSGNPTFNPPAWRPVTARSGGQSPWSTARSNVVFTPDDDQRHGIELSGKPILDQYGYNLPLNPNADMFVSDVMLQFVLIPKRGKGELSLLLSKGNDEFRATVRSDGTVSLERGVSDRTRRRGAVEIDSGKIPPLADGTPIRIEFKNVDYRVALAIDGREILATTDQDYRPNIARLRAVGDGGGGPARVEIAAQSLQLEIRHLRVFRDVFYRSKVNLDAHSPTGLRNQKYRNQPGWGTLGYPILLRGDPGDYFCCGDNSPQSKDSRLWWEIGSTLARRGDYPDDPNSYQPGTVPADQMIGRAFFVYWPSGFRIFSTPFGFIPNVGRMRIIR